MSLLITGAAGAIGSYLMRRFADDGLAPRGTDVTPGGGIDRCDVANVDAFAAYVADRGIRDVVHCAGKLDVSGSLDPLELVRANVLGLTTVCATMRAVPGARVVYVSSRGVYPWRRAGAIPRAVAEGDPLEIDVNRSVYDLTKYAMEMIAQRYALQYGLAVCGLRLASTFGIGKSSARHGHQAILVEMFHAARRGEAVRLLGSDQHSDFVYYGDVYQACLRLVCAAPPVPGILNVGGGLRPISSYVDALSRLFPDARLEAGPGADYLGSGGYGYVGLDCARAQDLLGYRPRYGPAQAFAEMDAILGGARDPWFVSFDDVRGRAPAPDTAG